MRDEQVRRYSRHILLPDVGGLGQTALLVATARVELQEVEPTAELVCAMYLAAGGVGTVFVHGASDAQLAMLRRYAADSKVERPRPGEPPEGKPVTLQPRPPWWPETEGDDTALAFFRGALAATRWMADVANR